MESDPFDALAVGCIIFFGLLCVFVLIGMVV